MDVGRITLILIAFLCFSSCQKNDFAKITQNYLNAYENLGFDKISPYLSDTITIIDGSYQKSYPLDDFQVYYEWDSVFNPQFDLLEISSTDNNVFLIVSSQSKRFEFLGNNPFITRQKISFKERRIYKIEILENIDIDWDLWTRKRDSLVKWTNSNHPELSGFINDMTKAGSEKYLKAIDLYNNKE